MLVGVVSLGPLRFLGLASRRSGALLVGFGLLAAFAGAALPIGLVRPAGQRTRLDDFVPAYHFHELHSIRIEAPADRVFRAAKDVTAGEIRFFRLLTWIRSPRLRGGKETILAAPQDKPILPVALRSGFLLLAEEADRELVFGGLMGRRRAGIPHPSPDDFAAFDRPGYSKVAMNFLVEPESAGLCRLTTETRVFSLDPGARRRFAAYWRVIYPGSALIRRMWLEAIRRRAEDPRLRGF